MLARDIYPTRLDRAKAELARFIDTLKGDRVGLVAFAGETMSYPLTVDYEAAKLFWRDLTPDDMPVGGTDLGARDRRAATELLEARARARRQEARRRRSSCSITDGEDTEGRGLEAAPRRRRRLGIKIYTLGIGCERAAAGAAVRRGRQAARLRHRRRRASRCASGSTTRALKQIAHADRRRLSCRSIRGASASSACSRRSRGSSAPKRRRASSASPTTSAAVPGAGVPRCWSAAALRARARAPQASSSCARRRWTAAEHGASRRSASWRR